MLHHFLWWASFCIGTVVTSPAFCVEQRAAAVPALSTPLWSPQWDSASHPSELSISAVTTTAPLGNCTSLLWEFAQGWTYFWDFCCVLPLGFLLHTRTLPLGHNPCDMIPHISSSFQEFSTRPWHPQKHNPSSLGVSVYFSLLIDMQKRFILLNCCLLLDFKLNVPFQDASLVCPYIFGHVPPPILITAVYSNMLFIFLNLSLQFYQ